MKKKVLFASFLGIALFIFVFGADSDEQKLRDAIQEITILLSYERELHPFEQLAKAKEIARTVVSDFRAVLVTPDAERVIIADRSDTEKKALILFRIFRQLRISVSDFEVELQGDGAVVRVLVRATGMPKHEDRQFLEQHRVMLTFSQDDDGWKIISARNVEPINLPAYDE